MTDPTMVDQLIAEFREKAEPLGVTVTRVTSPPDAVPLLEGWLSSQKAGCLTVATELSQRLPEFVCAIESNGIPVRGSGTPAETRDAPAGLSLAHLAIAETGSLLLSEPSLADRSVGMLTLAHAILCPTSALVATLDDAVPALRQFAMTPGGAFSTLVTGPSRTADIERVLTVGVQGPGVVMTLFIDDL